jgi:hypothetical protein
VQRAGVQLLERLLPGEAGESWAERLAWLDPPGVRLQDDGEPRVLTVARCPLPGRTGPCRFPVAVLLWLRDGQGPLALYGTVEHAHEMRRTFGPGWSRHRSQLGAFPEWAQLLAPPQDDARPVRCAQCCRSRPYDHDEMRRLAAKARGVIG